MRTGTKILLAVIAAALLFWIANILATPFDELFTTTGPAAKLLFVILIITEVVIAPIPGGVIGLLGAAHFGFAQGWLLMYVGNVIGSSAVFLLARTVGRPYVEKAVKKRQRKPYEHLMSEYPKTFWALYAIPILPIDVLSILLGLTDTKFKRFFTISAIGLITYTGIWSYIGAYWISYIPYLEYISTATLLAVLGLIAWYLYKEFWHQINWKKLTKR